jgi:DNA-binding MarR family transcriptional regulator
MHFRWTPERVDDACARIRSGCVYEQIASDMGITKSAITGLVMRLRNAGDDRLPAIARKPFGTRVKAQGQIAVLAELMAEGCASITDAAREMGVTRSWADQLWQRIRADLGEQAR